ncbi:MAG: aldehyde dehydrogenase (NADP(+)), partial [Acidobacteriota bacterium]
MDFLQLGLDGKNQIAGKSSALGQASFRAYSANTGEAIGPVFVEATEAEVDLAATSADQAFDAYSTLPPDKIATFLEAIAEGIVNLGDGLIQCAAAETALHVDRITGERGRTVNQLKLFADLVRQGKWKDVRVDPALPDRKPLKRSDLRRTMIPVGPVAIWAASNFPLAFSVAGGDTAAALAAGCPVIVKAHPGHPCTSELVARVIGQVVAKLDLPPGSFSMLQGTSPAVSIALVSHPKIASGAFTGSLRAGRALFDAAAQRPEPIPFFAEMGSVNPVFLLEGALAERGSAMAEGLAQSVNMGVGQFCTCPGLALAVDSPSLTSFATELRGRFQSAKPGTMLTTAIAKSYVDAVQRVEVFSKLKATKATALEGLATPVLFETDAATFLQHPELRHEVFGPATILVTCASVEEM